MEYNTEFRCAFVIKTSSVVLEHKMLEQPTTAYLIHSHSGVAISGLYAMPIQHKFNFSTL